MKPHIVKLLKNPQRPQTMFRIYAAENGKVLVERVFSVSQVLIDSEYIPEDEIKAWTLKKLWNEYRVIKKFHRTKFPNDPIKNAGGKAETVAQPICQFSSERNPNPGIILKERKPTKAEQAHLERVAMRKRISDHLNRKRRRSKTETLEST